MNRNRIAFLVFSALGLASAAIAACAPDSGFGPTSSGNPGGTSSGAGGSGGEGGGDIGFLDGGPGSGGGTPDPDAACGLVTEQGKATPLSLYIAFDKSNSMFGTKWDSGEAGLGAFVSDPASAGTTVALNFFPLPEESTCDQFKYKTPAVPFAELPANADPIIQAIAAQDPTGVQTPIYPALGGAILACNDQLKQNPGTSCAVLLVTDGEPVGPAPLCGGVDPDNPQSIADLAKKGVDTFGVRTFVIGLQGVSPQTANLIAAAGGTDSAILVGSVNIQQEFQNALAKARGKALPCEYEMPTKVANGEIDPSFVNILFTPSAGGSPKTILQDASCANGVGWYYDNPASPTKIHFCPSTCQTVRADFGAKVQILLGCKTETPK